MPKTSEVLRSFVNHAPVAVVIPATVIGTIGVVLLGVWLVRRFIPVTREGFDAEVSSQMLGVVASLFGLLLAFVIVIEFQNFGGAQDNVAKEADSLAAIVRDTSSFPPAQAQLVRRAVGIYIRQVTNDEWPALRLGHEGTQATKDVSGIYAAFQQLHPTTPQTTAFYNDAVRQLNEALVARRDRLSAASGGLPPLILALIAVGAVIILGYVLLVGSRRFWFHAIGACSISVIIVLSLVVLVDLSYPFSGDLVVSSSPFKTGELAPVYFSVSYPTHR